jgi:hypothetical protein
MNMGRLRGLRRAPHAAAAAAEPPPHRSGERAMPTRWRLGRAEPGRRGSGPRHEGEGGRKKRAAGGRGKRRLGRGRLAGPRREKGEGRGGWAAGQARPRARASWAAA